MKPSIEKLQKFFRLEADRNYDDKAVMGGLGSMLASWEADARADELPEEIIQAVITRLRDYGRLSADSRREVLKGLWNRVRNAAKQDGDEDSGELEPESAEEQSSAPPDEQPVQETSPVEPKPKKEQQIQKSEKVEKKESKSRKRRQPRPAPEGPSAALDADVTVLDGVGPKNAEKLANLGIHNLGDMLYHFPRRYDDYSKLKPINRLRYGEEVTIIGTVQSVMTRDLRGGKTKLLEVIINDGSAALRINFFNQPWLANNFKEGMPLVISGKVDQYLGRYQMNGPEWEQLDEDSLHTNRIVPVYPSTAKLTQRWLREQMNKVVTYWAPRVQETLPYNVIKTADLMPLSEALFQAHFPDSEEDLQDARYRLAFDEIFYLQMGVVRQKAEWETREGKRYEVSQDWLDARLNALPYQLTGAQHKALADIRQDFTSGKPMNRLLQGDVGSGKTVIAALGVGMITSQDAQAAILAPTSILAEQHYKSMQEILTEENGILNPEEIGLMLGSTPEKEKNELRSALQEGRIKVIVGTHALLEDPVRFKNLQMTVIDEQHRFGVEQRAILREKGDNPHLLVMTATPIPRSLALTIYGDLDLTVMDEMPPGRQPVDTYVLYPRERERAYTLIRNEVEKGHQAFVITPLVEESEKSDSKAAVEEQERLQKEVFQLYKVGLLHGRMKPDEKEAMMTSFRDGEYHVLVSTTVVEVGVDVPNATVMLIEGANRFGLAQLHQLRGRVGRGGGDATCLLLPESDDAVENERLQAMVETNDGFVLAERDLQQRGPGEFLGTRQSGFNDLQMAAITNVRLIEDARKQAQAVLQDDPNLVKPEHQLLVQYLNRFWQTGQGDIS